MEGLESVVEVGKQIVTAGAFEIGDAGGGLAPGRDRLGRPPWLRLPSLGLALSLSFHALPIGVLLLLGHAASESPGAAPGRSGIEIAVAFGLPDAERGAETLPELLPVPALAAPPEPDVVVVVDTAASEPAKVHVESPPMPKPEPSKPKVVQKPKAAPAPAPEIEPQQLAAAPAGTTDAPERVGESLAPLPTEAAKGVSTPGPATGLSPPRDGGPLVVLDPAYREPPTPPVYPSRSVMLGQQGQVIVRAAIDPRGNPEEVVVWTSSGFPLLDKAAIDAVKRWRFIPARRGASAVAAWVQVPVNFRLR